MKKLFAIIFSLAVLAGCTVNESTEVTEASVTSSETESSPVTSAEKTETTVSETTAVTTEATEETSVTAAAVTAEKLPIEAELCINADGTLNELFTEMLARFAMPDEPVFYFIYPSLWDFDGDGVPEIILIHNNGGQGRMPCYVYSAENLEEIGEFDGFCRDGYTRFINNDEGTVIYNFYEHSDHIRFESVEKITLKAGKLISESETRRNWTKSNEGEFNPRLEYREGSSNTEERNDWGFVNRTAEYYGGDVCTSFDNEIYNVKEAAANAVESYNNYIKAKALPKNDEDRLLIFGDKNQYAFLQEEEGCFFIDENGGRTLLKEGWAYIDLYRIWDGIIVGQPLGNTQPCDVYVMTDGKPVLDEKLSGHGMYFDYSHFYNCRFEIIESVYDASSAGGHTFKKYQLYRDKDGFHEYGSIEVPLEEFNSLYSEAAQKCIDSAAEETECDLEIFDVLYRGDGCFILNCRSPIFCEEGDEEACGYHFYNLTLKPTDEEFSIVYLDSGVYKTALIPEIAVYPEAYYKEGEEWSKCIVY